METLNAHWRRYNALQKAMTIMAWDQAVLMPTGGSEARAAHMAVLAKKAHQELTSDEMRLAAESLASSSEPGSDERAAAEAVLREIRLSSAIPEELVGRERLAGSRGYDAWKKARAENDFATFAPFLSDVVSIQREIADCRGFNDHVYDALTDKYEQGATFRLWRSLFDELAPGLREILAQLPEQASDDILHHDFDPATLKTWAVGALTQIGFDFQRGRLDLAPNAFATNFSTTDVRMTTRHKPGYMGGVIFSSLHELGHALYEQRSPEAWDRTPLVGGISLGVHESQSRFWENVVGRSEGFWTWGLPRLNQAMGRSYEPKELLGAIRRIEPGFIRIGSDEITYNLHILCRFELECDLLTGSLDAKDLPEAWNAKYAEQLGVNPTSDAVGCLQDVHWSKGSFGYFPTYTLGNLISWQCWEAISEDIPNAEEGFARGDFAPVADWLTERIYAQGKRFGPQVLTEKATGRPYGDPAAYLSAMRKRYLGQA